jgi:hypothetical protein
MPIKQQGGVFGRHPTFNTVDVDGVLNTGGNVKVGGTTLSNPNSYGNILNVQGYAPAVVLTETDTGKNYTLGINGQSLRLIEGTTVRTTFDTSGNLTVNTGNLIIGTSGKGIDFSATSGTGTSELFDDYEEGTWTPTTAGDATGVITGAVGQYTKIGRLVQCQCQFQVTTNFTSNAIDGLPFVPRIQATLSNQYGSYAVNTDGTGNVFFRINDAGTSAAFEETTGQGGTDHLPNTTNNRYMFCFTYETDS